MPYKDKEQEKEYRKKYYLENKDKILQRVKDFSKTEAGKKNHKIAVWKSLGMINDDWDKVYEWFKNTTNCELCNVVLIEGKGLGNFKCLDHDHDTGEVRNILCGNCNINVLGRPKRTEEEKKEIQKKWREQNKEKIKEDKSKKYVCEICGGKFTHSNENKHLKTNKHISFVNNTSTRKHPVLN